MSKIAGETVVRLLDVLNRHRWWILGTFLLVALGAMGAYHPVPRRYTASAEVWLDCSADAVTAGQSGGCTGMDRRSDRVAETALLASPRIAARVVDRLNLAARHAITANAPGSMPDDAAAALSANVEVRNIEGANAAVVSYRDVDPARAADVTNRLVGEYVADRHTTGARAGRIEHYRGRAADALRMMTRTVTAASTSRAAADPNEEDDPERLRRDAAALDSQLADLRARGAASISDTTDPSAADSSVGTLQAQLAQLIASRVKLQERYGPLHPDIISMNARIANLIDRIAVTTDRLQRASEAARRAHERLDQQLAAAARREETQSRLDTAATFAASRYQQSLQDLRAAETLPSRGDAHVLTAARLSSAPPPLDRSTVVAIGFLAALVGAGGVVAVRELGGPGLRSRRSAERKLGLPVIGMVPEACRVGEPGAVADLVLSDTALAFIAAFTDINRRLGIGADGTRVIAVTSAFEAEGKTTVAIGIARLAALAGLQVLLIDCDVRRPAATRAIAPDAAASLADVLAGKIDVAHARVRDPASGAWILPSGIGGAVGAVANGLVGTDAMLKLVEQAKADYHLVLLDMAPVLALVETRLAAAFAERVLLVARWRKTPVKAIRLAIDLLDGAGSGAAALILTRVAT